MTTGGNSEGIRNLGTQYLFLCVMKSVLCHPNPTARELRHGRLEITNNYLG